MFRMSSERRRNLSSRRLVCGVSVVLALGSLLVSHRAQAADEKPAAAATEQETLAKIDASAQKAAAFLRQSRNKDNGWGARGSDVGITGLVVDALARAPESIRKANQDLIDDGVKYILANQRPDGALVNKDGRVANYRTSIAARTLILIDKDKYKDAIAAAAKFVKSCQGTDSDDKGSFGGMGYGSEGGRADTTNTAEAIEMLKQAGVPEDDPVYKRAMVFLGRVQSSDEFAEPGVKTDNSGGGIYTTNHAADEKSHQPTIKLPDGTLVMKSYGGATYALLMSQLFCGMKKDNPRVQAAYKWVCDHYTVKEHPELGRSGLYYYYYTMVRTLELWGSPTVKQGDTEHNWAKELALELISQQKDNGSWVNAQDRWWEGDASLVTAYGLFTLDTCRSMLTR